VARGARSRGGAWVGVLRSAKDRWAAVLGMARPPPCSCPPCIPGITAACLPNRAPLRPPPCWPQHPPRVLPAAGALRRRQLHPGACRVRGPDSLQERHEGRSRHPGAHPRPAVAPGSQLGPDMAPGSQLGPAMAPGSQLGPAMAPGSQVVQQQLRSASRGPPGPSLASLQPCLPLRSNGLACPWGLPCLPATLPSLPCLRPGMRLQAAAS
jgi:hypothetical protein